ncbi:MAG: bifunctional D-glycero-beta-D-manno-heptose-7-phosphate kinase/D-glycero-beta-D-manno-heptose 1-phosphate adenylyltransferase HldE [Pseudomonadaceae bacterium]|nr:bifunctional D-glycero-beta-D-manno-heptose-7-phosphate kinase/D-glycero-beta-D-manno-heptose 1-phosphate adenylyltransferase HldE [Pseudomonadaceae bacterium]
MLPNALPSIANLHVLVVGDVMLDRYWHGNVERISQEAPVPVVGISGVDDRPGGAANVALNLVSLGAQCTLVSAVGEDEAGMILRERLEAAGVRCAFVPAPGTTMKLRMVSGGQQLIRADFDVDASAQAAAVVAEAERHVGGCDVAVVEDYDKGSIAQPQNLLARLAPLPVLVDPKAKTLAQYTGAKAIKPNEAEFIAAFGGPLTDVHAKQQAVSFLHDASIDALVVTQGARGIRVLTTDGQVHAIPARPVDVFDVTGAGDTAAAALALGLALDWSIAQAAELANVAAGVAVTRSGTAAVSGPELAEALAGMSGSQRGVVSQSALLGAVAQMRGGGERIVFTNGCFDILHAGHVAYLAQARELGDRLVVAVNDDASVARLKGKGRPVNTLHRRMTVLAGLASVDWVVSFSDDTPEPLLAALKPDVLVKGGDYQLDAVVGAELVREYGGEVRVLSEVADLSTTNIVKKIKNPEGD